jgi:hypothetical protein
MQQHVQSDYQPPSLARVEGAREYMRLLRRSDRDAARERILMREGGTTNLPVAPSNCASLTWIKPRRDLVEGELPHRG